MILRTACVFFAIVLGAETLPFSNMNVRQARTIYGDQNFHRLYNARYPFSRHPERKPLGMFSGRHQVSSSYPPAQKFSDLYNRVKEISADLRPSRFMTPTHFSLNNYFDNVHQETAQKLNRFGQRVTEAMQQRENHHAQSMQHVKEMLHQRFGPESTMERLKQIFREKQALMNKLNENKWHDKFVAVPFYTMNDDHKIVKKPGVDTGSLFNLKPNNEVPNSLHVPAIESIGTQHPVIPEVTTSSFLLQESEAPATIAEHMVPITLNTHIPEVTDTIWVTNYIIENESTTPKPPSDTSSKTDTTASIDSTTEVAFLETKVTEISNTSAVETSSITDSAFTSATIAPESTTESISTFSYEISTDTTASGSGYASIQGSTDTQEMNTEGYSILLHSMIPNPKNMTSEEISTTAVSTEATETPEVMTLSVEASVPVADDYSTSSTNEAESTTQAHPTSSSTIPIAATDLITEGMKTGDPAVTDSTIGTTLPSAISNQTTTPWKEIFDVEVLPGDSTIDEEMITENIVTLFPDILTEASETTDSLLDKTTEVISILPSAASIEETESPEITTLVDELSVPVADDYVTNSVDETESTTTSSSIQIEDTALITEGMGIGYPAETDSLIGTENVVDIISTSPSTITIATTTTIEPETSTTSNSAIYSEKTTDNYATSFPTIFAEPTTTAASSFDMTTKVTPTFPPTVLIEESGIPAMTTLVDELSILVDDDYFTSLTDGMESTSEIDSKYSSTIPTEATSQITGGLDTVELEFDETTFEVDDTKIIDPRSTPDRTTASLVETYTTGSIFDDSTIDREITMGSISTQPTDTTTTASTSSIDSFPNYNEHKEEEGYSSPNDETLTTRVTSMLVSTVPTETTEDPEKITFLEESSEVVDVDTIGSTDSNSITTDTVTMIPERSTNVIPAFTYADTDSATSTEIVSTISTETPTSSEQMVTTRSPFDSSLIDEQPTTDVLWQLSSTNPIETTTMLPERLTAITTFDELSATDTDAVSIPLERESTTTSWLYDESSKHTTEEVDSVVFSTLLPEGTENPEITYTLPISSAENVSTSLTIDEQTTTTIIDLGLSSTISPAASTMVTEKMTTVDRNVDDQTNYLEKTIEFASTVPSPISYKTEEITTVDENVDDQTNDLEKTKEFASTFSSTISYETTDYPWIEISTGSTLTSDIPTKETEIPETIERHSISTIESHPEFSSASPTEASTIVDEGSTADDHVFTDSTIEPGAVFISSSTSSNEITDSEVGNSATGSTFDISTIDKEPTEESVFTFSPEISTETATMVSDGSTQFVPILDELVIDQKGNAAYVLPTVSADVTTTTDSSFESTMMRTDDSTLASETSTETTTFVNEVTKYTEVDSIGSVDEAKSTTEGYPTFSSTNAPESITTVAEGSPTVDQASTDSTINTEETHSTILTETTTSSTSTELPQNNSTNYDETVDDETVSTFSFTNPTESTTNVPETFTSIESFLRDSTIDESTTMKFGGSTFSSPMSTESTTSVEEIPTAASIPSEIASATERETIEEVHSILYSDYITTDTPKISAIWDVLQDGSTTETTSEDDYTTETATELPFAISTETTSNFEEMSASTELTLDSSVDEGDSTVTFASTIPTETFTISDEISTVSTTSNSSTVADDETTTEIASTLPTTILAETTDSPGDNYRLKTNENYTNPDVESDQAHNRTGRVLRDTSHHLPPWFSRTVQSVTNEKAALNSIPLTIEDLRAKRSLSHIFGDTLPLMVERSRIKQWEPMNHQFETFFDEAYRRLTIDDQRKNQG